MFVYLSMFVFLSMFVLSCMLIEVCLFPFKNGLTRISQNSMDILLIQIIPQT